MLPIPFCCHAGCVAKDCWKHFHVPSSLGGTSNGHWGLAQTQGLGFHWRGSEPCVCCALLSRRVLHLAACLVTGWHQWTGFCPMQQLVFRVSCCGMLSAVTQGVAKDCGLDGILPRHWVAPVDGVLPHSGFRVSAAPVSTLCYVFFLSRRVLQRIVG
jgi:hypothetical protein